MHHLFKIKKDNNYKVWSGMSIIAGFPGIGKSTLAKACPDMFIDLESSDYHWITDENGKHVNPSWPYNYVNEIKMILLNHDARGPQCILISTHKEVLDMLHKSDIYFAVAIPETVDFVKKIYKQRGSSPEFIEKVTSNFDNFMEDISKSNAAYILQGDKKLSELIRDAITIIGNTIKRDMKNYIN